MKLTCNQLMLLAALYRGSPMGTVSCGTYKKDIEFLNGHGLTGMVPHPANANILTFGLTEKGTARVKAALDVELPPELKPFSVLLLYPDYLSDNGRDTYYTHVMALDEEKALDVARLEAAEANGYERESSDPACDPDDFWCLSVIAGHHETLL